MKIIRRVVRASHKDVNGCSPNRKAPRHPSSAARGRGAQDADHGTVDADHATVELARAGGFRIVEFNVLGNHLHLIVEADCKDALSRGVQGFCVSAARRLNSALMRKGKLFAQRYHARALRTPREVRNALRYVLLNRKHHDAEKSWGRFWIDPSSSAAWFRGWAQPVRPDAPWKRELLDMPKPTAEPETWLLSTGWKRHGLLRFDEQPG